VMIACGTAWSVPFGCLCLLVILSVWVPCMSWLTAWSLCPPWDAWNAIHVGLLSLSGITCKSMPVMQKTKSNCSSINRCGCTYITTTMIRILFCYNARPNSVIVFRRIVLQNCTECEQLLACQCRTLQYICTKRWFKILTLTDRFGRLFSCLYSNNNNNISISILFVFSRIQKCGVQYSLKPGFHYLSWWPVNLCC